MKENHNIEEKILVLSALLHDIGKLVQRASSNFTEKKHEEFGGEFLERYLHTSSVVKDEVIKIVKAHHRIPYDGNYPHLLRIVKEADVESAIHDRDESEGVDEHINKSGLLSVVSYVSIGKNRGGKKYYPVTSLKEGAEIKLVGEQSVNDIRTYRICKRSLANDLDNLNIMEKSDINTLTYILFKHTRFIPSAVYVSIPDIPLFDHLKTTAAIALCKYRSQEKKNYLLIMGDLSGIQNYIFSTLKGGEEQAVDEHGTKRMRGRSLIVNLIIDSAVKYIVEKLDLYEFNVLWQSGGNFLILAPNTKNVDNILKKARKDINKFLLETFGNLYLNIAWERYENLNEFDKILESLHLKLDNEIKPRRYLDFVREENFYIRNIPAGKYLCPACGVHPVDNKGEICEICQKTEKLGEDIGKRRYLLRVIGEGNHFTFKYGDLEIGYSLTDKCEEDKEVYAINSFKIPFSGESRGFKFIKTYVPMEMRRVLSISELVTINEIGEKAKIGIFKADVDCLGEIFARGLKNEEKSKISISRISMLSFLFDYFFTVKVNEIAKNDDIYIVFSGGDDLTALGRYDKIIQFASDIQEHFKIWMGENPNIHLSAAVLFFDEKFPIRRAVEIADEELEKAKNWKKEFERCVERGNRISIFNHVLPWEDFNVQIKLGRELFEYQKKGIIPSSFSHYLLKLHALSPSFYAKKPLSKGDVILPSPKPYILYYFGRRKKNEEVEKLLTQLLDRHIFHYIPVGVSLWVMYRKYKKWGDVE